MKPCQLVLVVFLVSSANTGIAGEKTDLTRRYQEIQSEYDEARQRFTESLKAGKMDRQIIPNAVAQRKQAFQELAKEAESLDSAKFTSTDHETLARVHQGLDHFKEAAEHAQAALRENADNPSLQVLLVTVLANDELDDAEKAFSDALEKCTNREPLESLHGVLYRANLKHRRPVAAADHLAAIQGKLRANLANTRQSGAYFRQLDQMIDGYVQGNETEKALASIDLEIAEVEKMRDLHPDADLDFVVVELEGKKIVTLGNKLGRAAEAETLADARIKESEESLQESPEDTKAVLRIATLGKAKLDITAPERREAQSEQWIAFVEERVGKNPDNTALLSLFLAYNLDLLQRLAGEERFDEIQKLDETLKRILAAVPESVAKTPSIAAQRGSINSLLRRTESKRLHRDLIGRPMVPLDVTAWVNGSPISNEDLKGKVVLLDFWAVWCGPCRATFPHLTEWHEKYADKGLVIVGLTQYYGYGWDDKEQKHVRLDDLSEEDEQSAVVKFAEHHGLKHRLAYMPKGSSVSRAYGVYGIPQAVLIDRAGNVRLIRVGSGEKNAHEIQAAIEEELGFPPNSANGSGP